VEHWQARLALRADGIERAPWQLTLACHSSDRVTASGDIDRVGLALTVDGLDKTYADGTRALDGLTLHISLSTRGHGRHGRHASWADFAGEM
jgi:hypothetical protein